MNKKDITSIIGNWRCWILATIAIISALCILSDTITEAITFWFILIKVIGFVAAYIFYRLFVYWAKHRKIDGLLKIAFND